MEYEELYNKVKLSNKRCARLIAYTYDKVFACPIVNNALPNDYVEHHCLTGHCSRYVPMKIKDTEESIEDFIKKFKQFKSQYCDNMTIDEEACCIRCSKDNSMLCRDTIENICKVDANNEHWCDDKHITIEDCKPYDEQDTCIQENDDMNDINFYDYCTTQETMHKVYSTMLNPFATNAPRDYADFFNNAERENLVLHKLNCIICALKQSGNSYAQNIEYFTRHDMENIERDFVRKLRVEL